MNTNTQKKSETWEEQREREAREAKEQRAKLQKKFRAIAKALGYTLKDRDNAYDAWADLEGQNGETIYLTGGGYNTKGRICVSPTFPKDKRGQETRSYVVGYGKTAPSITVSDEKTPDQIAADIKRRFLPEYLPLLEKAKELIKNWNEYDDRRASNFEMVVGRKPRTGADAGQERDGKTRISLGKLDKAQEYESDIEVNVSNDVTLEIRNLTPVIARAVVDLLKSRTLPRAK